MSTPTAPTGERRKAGKVYVRITFRDHTGKRFHWWAQKLGSRNYRKVGRDGSWGEDRTDHHFLGTTETEKPAMMNRTYCQLETDTEKV